MRKLTGILLIILFLMTGCDGGKKASNGDVIVVDVNASYPKKELILQDLMDVEYVPLETNDEFITDGIVLVVGKEMILIRNKSDGSIFIFDRNGKALRKINRYGNGPEEYLYNYNVILDEDNDEISVIDNSKKKTFVYDLYGNFKRFIRHKENVRISSDTYNYGRDSFIWWDSSFEYSDSSVVNNPLYFITAKHDGGIIREIELPLQQRKTAVIIQRDPKSNVTYSWSPSGFKSIVHYDGEFILVDPSSDTIYRYTSDNRMQPFIVRTPSIHSMSPEVFLFPSVITDRYCFMSTYVKSFDGEGADFIYDMQTKEIFKYTMYNDDFSSKKREGMELWGKSEDKDVANVRRLEAHELVEAYQKGELKGQLKEVASKLDEDSNPVIMLMKHRR